MSKTARFLNKIRDNSEKQYRQKINYAKGAFLPFDRCKNSGTIFFASHVKIENNKMIEMVKTF